MANGLNGILGGFETSRHVLIKRGFIRQYIVALGMSLLLSLLLIVTVSIIVVLKYLYKKQYSVIKYNLSF
jgi:membrane protein